MLHGSVGERKLSHSVQIVGLETTRFTFTIEVEDDVDEYVVNHLGCDLDEQDLAVNDDPLESFGRGR